MKSTPLFLCFISFGTLNQLVSWKMIKTMQPLPSWTNCDLSKTNISRPSLEGKSPRDPRLQCHLYELSQVPATLVVEVTIALQRYDSIIKDQLKQDISETVTEGATNLLKSGIIVNTKKWYIIFLIIV